MLKYILFFSFITIIIGKCPDSSIIYPCTCENNAIIKCVGNSNINLKRLFIDLSNSLNTPEEKHFLSFKITNAAVTELPENVFHDIKFDSITIYDATRLTKIHSNAFASIASAIKSFDCNPCYLVNSPPQYDLYHALKGMVNVQFIRIISPLLTSIPDNAFRSVNSSQSDLTNIFLGGESFKAIGNYAFYDVNNLQWLYIRESKINYIPSNAFNFRKSSNSTLHIYLNNNNLNGSSFGKDAFSNSKRPLEVLLFNNHIDYIDEKVFSSFFRVNADNKVIVSNSNPLNCSDCRTYWAFKQRNQLKDKLLGPHCTSGKSLWDPTLTDFNHCT